ncbi:hypothetical protein SFUMM280S_02931 [Streptomyces fumanus]
MTSSQTPKCSSRASGPAFRRGKRPHVLAHRAGQGRPPGVVHLPLGQEPVEQLGGAARESTAPERRPPHQPGVVERHGGQQPGSGRTVSLGLRPGVGQQDTRSECSASWVGSSRAISVRAALPRGSPSCFASAGRASSGRHAFGSASGGTGSRPVAPPPEPGPSGRAAMANPLCRRRHSGATGRVVLLTRLYARIRLPPSAGSRLRATVRSSPSRRAVRRRPANQPFFSAELAGETPGSPAWVGCDDAFRPPAGRAGRTPWRAGPAARPWACESAPVRGSSAPVPGREGSVRDRRAQGP